MNLNIRAKLNLFCILIICCTLVIAFVGSTLLNIHQTQRQNKARLTNALARAEKRIKNHLYQFKKSATYYLNKDDLIYAASVSVMLDASYHLVTRAGDDFFSFATDTNVDALAFYSALKFQGDQKLRAYYSAKIPPLNFLEKKDTQIPQSTNPGLFIVNAFNGKHLFHETTSGFYTPEEVDDPNLFPEKYQSEQTYSLDLRNDQLLLIAHLKLTNPKDNIFLKKGTHIGYFVLEKHLNKEIQELEKDLGLNIALYTKDGKLGKSQVLLPDINVDSALFSKDKLTTLTEQSGETYDSLVVPLRFEDILYGYLSVHISQQENQDKINEHIRLSLMIAILVIIFVILISYFFITQFTRPIIALARASSDFGSGELAGQVEISGNDELSLLARSFSSMRDAIADKMDLLEKNLVTIEDKNRELEKLDQLKDEFLAKTSHELRTPIHGIISLADAMLATKGKDPLEQSYQLSLIISNGRRLNNLISDLLDFYKMKNVGVQIKQEPLFIQSLIESVLLFCKPLITNHPIELITEVSLDFPPIQGDRERIEQILYNLISNAIKFTQEGEIKISASVQPNQTATIFIKDTGIGIPYQHQEKIFESFTQFDQSPSQHKQGTGLGLSIARSLVELHGGNLLIESEEGEGSCFYFSLPLSTDKNILNSHHQINELTLGQSTSIIGNRFYSNFQSETHESVKYPEINKEIKPIYTILIVDDEPINLNSLSSCLSEEGYNVIKASTGKEAITQLEIQPPDLVLLDLMMPQMSGIEVCRHIRQYWDLVTVPVIVLSAKVQLTDLEEAFQAGANDYLTKPFHLKEVTVRVYNQLIAKAAVSHLRKNQSLTEEINYHKQLETELVSFQKCLIEIIDQEKNAIICLDKSEHIVFFNRGAHQLIGYNPSDILGKSAQFVFDNDFIDHTVQQVRKQIPIENPMINIRKKDGTWLTHEIYISLIQIDKKEWITIVFPHKNSTDINNLISDKKDDQSSQKESLKQIIHNQERISVLEKSLSGILGQVTSLKSPDELEAQMNSYTLPEDIEALKEKKQHTLEEQHRIISERQNTIVDVMQDALECWEIDKGLTKLDLAEQSGIWHVNIEDGCYKKTRTMDRYFNHRTLPKKPKIINIIRTGLFVLEHTTVPSHKIKLEASLSRLKTLHRLERD